MPTRTDAGHYALRSSGRTVHLRPVTAADRQALLALFAATSDRSFYLRFFSSSRTAAEHYVDRLLADVPDGHATPHAILADVDAAVVGLAAFEPAPAGEAEVALLVADASQHTGIGTLLLEQLAAQARGEGITSFVADVLADNTAMIRTFRDLGFACRSTTEFGVARTVIELAPTPAMLAAMDARERTSDVASLAPLLAPSSIAVIGAGRRATSVGHQILRNIVDNGFTGTVYAVNPHHEQVMGVRCVADPQSLPEAVDLAVIAVPATAVVEVVAACGRRGVRAVLVVSAGFSETGADGLAEQHVLLHTVRRYGMRMVGPNCLGIINTDPAISLNATFAPMPVTPGGLALVSQSGALGIAVVQAAGRCGLGLSQFVSAGNKADVSGNDLLMWWEQDRRTDVIALYLESVGNPRKFARIARRVAAHTPIIAIKSGRSAAGRKAGQSHTAAAASADVVVDALFEQAGVLRMDTIEQLLDAARALSGQPLPAGDRVGIIGNSGGPEILAADAASTVGLEVVELSEELRTRLQALAPSLASAQNPIDLGASVQPSDVAACVAALAGSGEVDAVLAVFTETLVSNREDIVAAVGGVTAAVGIPLLLTQVGAPPTSVSTGEGRRRLVVFGYPERAAWALGASRRYARIAATALASPERPAGIDVAAARALVQRALQAGPAAGGGWLEPDDVAALLGHYGIALAGQRVVASPAEAVAAAAQLGYPVVGKLADATVHKTDVGGVLLDLRTPAEVVSAFERLATAGGGRMLLQQQLPEGIELIVGGVQDEQFGPVVMIGAGGVFADLLAERRFLLAPLDAHQASEAIGALRFARLLDGYRGRQAVSRPALTTLLERVGWLLEDLPEVAELDLNPVIPRGADVVAVDSTVRLAHAAPRPDPAVRWLRDATV
jgi:acyl-CoA synthetase (NDP forming)/GNAT superfamily N-acetyltransferase